MVVSECDDDDHNGSCSQGRGIRLLLLQVLLFSRLEKALNLSHIQRVESQSFRVVWVGGACSHRNAIICWYNATHHSRTVAGLQVTLTSPWRLRKTNRETVTKRKSMPLMKGPSPQLSILVPSMKFFVNYRGGAAAARVVHTHKVAGSKPAPGVLFLVLSIFF